MARLTYQQRKGMAKSTFAVPGKKTGDNPAGKGGYPIPDAAHARNALARVSRFGTSTEKAAVRSKIAARFPDVGQSKGK